VYITRSCVSWRFNPRSPRGERRAVGEVSCSEYVVSIHAPRAGSDRDTSVSPSVVSGFNPRSPRGERRVVPISPCWSTCVSIHAPRAGSDPTEMELLWVVRSFNPRSPRGERRLGHGVISF